MKFREAVKRAFVLVLLALTFITSSFAQDLAIEQELSDTFAAYKAAPLHEKPSYFSQSFIAFRLRSIIREQTEESLQSNIKAAQKSVDVLRNHIILSETSVADSGELFVRVHAESKLNGKYKTIFFSYTKGATGSLYIDHISVKLGHLTKPSKGHSELRPL